MYCVGAKGRELTEFSENTILSWNRELQERVSGLLGTTDLPGRRCTLLETLGWLRAQPDLVAAKKGGFEYPLDEQIPRLSLEEIEDIARRGLVEAILLPVVDLEGAFDSWVEMVELQPHAPLFPVERLGQMLRIYAHILIEDDVLVSAVDARISEVVGGGAAASNARDRAMMFYKCSRLLDALREIHRARMGWFSGEMSKGLVLATLMTSQIYRELELPMAAKYSAMAAARLVGDDHKEFYARACFKAAEADYHQGAWFSSVQIADLGLRAHLLLAEDPYNWERYGHLQYVFFELSVILGIARAVDADYEKFVVDVLGQTKLDEFLDDMLQDLGVTPWWNSLTVQELGERAAEDLGHLAFSDGGERRSVSWKALGVEWVVRFDNAYEETLVGERLAAFAQITMSELATHDLALLPTRVAFDVKSATPEDDLTIQSHSDGEGTEWQVQLPRVEGNTADSIRKAGQETLTVVTAAIADVSVLPQSELMEIFDSVFAAGLHDKLSFGTIYDVALGDLVGPEAFKQAPRREGSPIPAEISPTPHQARSLEFTGKGPHYDTNKSINLVEGRYTNISNTLVATLPALKGHQAFLNVVERLRSDGWKDWHILTTVMNVAQNYRIQLRQPPRSEQEARQYFKAFTATENPDDPAPLALFSEGALRRAIRFSMPSTLKVWKLELRQNPPDMSALEALLASRYGYWTDDAPHENMFKSELMD